MGLRTLRLASIWVALWLPFSAPSADLISGFQDRSVAASAVAFDESATDIDADGDSAADDSLFESGAAAGVWVADATGTSGAGQSSDLGPSGATMALTASARANATSGSELAQGEAASESFADWIFQSDEDAVYRLFGELSAVTDERGDAFARIILEELVLSGDPIPLVDVSVSLDGIAPLDVPIALERDAVYRLTAVALAAGQVDGFAPIASGRATLSVAFEAVPEPTTWVLWCTAAGAWLVGRRLAGSEERA